MKRKILIISLSILLLALIVFTVYPAPKLHTSGGTKYLCNDSGKSGVMISRPLGLCTDFYVSGWSQEDRSVILPGFIPYNLDGCAPEINKLPGGKQCDWSNGKACCKQLGYRYFKNPIEPTLTIQNVLYTWGLHALAALIVSFFFGALIFFGLEKRISKWKAFLIPAIILQILVIIYWFVYLSY